MRVLMTGGGTAGHVNPALAIANTIKEKEPDSEIAFVGTPKGIENKLVEKAGYKIFHVDVMGIRRSLSPKNVKAAWLALTSPAKAKKIIRDFRPDVVIGTGGYVSWPVMKAAVQCGVPTALHECNAVAGMTVRMLKDSVSRVYLNFEEAGEGIPKEKVLTVGCPMLKKPQVVDRAEARRKIGIPEDKLYVLSFGGSLGAEKVNEAVLYLMENYTGGRDNIYHTLATGSIEKEIAFADFKMRGLDKYDNLDLREYIFDMPDRLAAADIVICRAGAMTLSELTVYGRCSVLIPSPNVTDDQQYKNAKILADRGAATVIREGGECPDKLLETVKDLCERPEKIRDCEKAAAEMGIADANERIYEDIVKLLNR